MTPAQLAALHARCFTSPNPWSAAEFDGFLQSPGAFLCTHETGFLLGRVAGPEAEIITIAVDPVAQRRGVARELIDAFHARARQSGAHDAFLEVAVDNEAAILLYLSCGYRESGRREGYYRTHQGKAVSALVMTRALSDT